MPQNLRQSIKFKNFNFPVSYNTNVQDKMKDAKNVYTNQDRLDTRNGFQRFNTNQIGASGNVLSISYFEDTDSNKYYIVKVGTVLYSISETGTHTEIKTGLSASTKHRSVSFNNRAIIAIGSDGLFAWDGTTFSQLGQAPPSAPNVGVSGSGNTLPASVYQVAYTFYSSTLGFETNIGAASSSVTISGTLEQIDVTAMAITAANEFIDKKRVYVKDITNNSEWIFWSEIDLVTATETIDAEITSTLTPPVKNAAPLAGGGKFLTIFGTKIVYAGSSQFESDVFFSEAYLPDAFDDSSDTRLVLKANGQGPVTGLATGFYNDSGTSPYLVVFKRGRIESYSEASGSPIISTVSSSVGCVSHDTIQEIDGDIYFMSESGWHIIQNGQILKKKDKAFKLGDGDIDNIFNDDGFVYELNKTRYENFFSTYYPTLNQYMTFVSEGANTDTFKAYNYEFYINGFRPYETSVSLTCGCLAKDEDGEEVLLFGGNDGRIYKHSINVTKTDVDVDNNEIDIDVFALLYWISHEDYDATMNFGTMIFQAIASSEPVTVKCFINYQLDITENKNYSFDDPATGFILDVSKLDEGILGDGRTIVRSLGTGIYKTARSLLIGFYQSTQNNNIGLIGGQIDASKNGNANV